MEAEVLAGLAERPDAPLLEVRALLPAATKGTAVEGSAAATQQKRAAFVAGKL